MIAERVFSPEENRNNVVTEQESGSDGSLHESNRLQMELATVAVERDRLKADLSIASDSVIKSNAKAVDLTSRISELEDQVSQLLEDQVVNPKEEVGSIDDLLGDDDPSSPPAKMSHNVNSK